MSLEPFLQLGDLPCALNLDVQFHILREAGQSKIAGADQSLRTDDLELSMCNVGLGVKLVAIVNSAFDSTFAKCIQDRGDPTEERVRVLGRFNTVVQLADGPGLDPVE